MLLNTKLDWRQKENGAAEDKMVREHDWLNGHEFKQTPEDSGGQKSLVCYFHGVAKSWTWLTEWQQHTKPTDKTQDKTISSVKSNTIRHVNENRKKSVCPVNVIMKHFTGPEDLLMPIWLMSVIKAQPERGTRNGKIIVILSRYFPGNPSQISS